MFKIPKTIGVIINLRKRGLYDKVRKNIAGYYRTVFGFVWDDFFVNPDDPENTIGRSIPQVADMVLSESEYLAAKKF